MEQLFKLTDHMGQTRGGTQWGPGIEIKAKGSKYKDLCSDGWIHAYENPYIAIIMNPNHANFNNPQLWLAEGKIEKNDRGLKCGVRKLKTIKRIKLPKLSKEQLVEFAIRCSLKVYKNLSYVKWAENWLNNVDRSANAAANTAHAAANAAAYTAAYTAHAAANPAAYTAAYTAHAAATVAAYTAHAAANVAAYTAHAAANAAANTAHAAANAAAYTAHAAANPAAYTAHAAVNFKEILEEEMGLIFKIEDF